MILVLLNSSSKIPTSEHIQHCDTEIKVKCGEYLCGHLHVRVERRCLDLAKSYMLRKRHFRWPRRHLRTFGQKIGRCETGQYMDTCQRMLSSLRLSTTTSLSKLSFLPFRETFQEMPQGSPSLLAAHRRTLMYSLLHSPAPAPLSGLHVLSFYIPSSSHH